MAEIKRSQIKESNTQVADPQEVNETGGPQDPGSLSPQNSVEESNTSSSGPTHEEIAARAYHCWQERGGAQGASEQDWYRAEQELRAEHEPTGHQSRSAAASA